MLNCFFFPLHLLTFRLLCCFVPIGCRSSVQRLSCTHVCACACRVCPCLPRPVQHICDAFSSTPPSRHRYSLSAGGQEGARVGLGTGTRVKKCRNTKHTCARTHEHLRTQTCAPHTRRQGAPFVICPLPRCVSVFLCAYYQSPTRPNNRRNTNERRQREARAGVRGLCARVCLHIGTAECAVSDEARCSTELLIRFEHIRPTFCCTCRAPTRKGTSAVQCSVRGSCKASRTQNLAPPLLLYPSFARSLAFFALTLSTLTLSDGCALAFFILSARAFTLLSLPCVRVCLTVHISLCVRAWISSLPGYLQAQLRHPHRCVIEGARANSGRS